MQKILYFLPGSHAPAWESKPDQMKTSIAPTRSMGASCRATVSYSEEDIDEVNCLFGGMWIDHGSGFVDNDGSGMIARGSVNGSYGGPDPPYPFMKHTYEITVKAYDGKGAVIGIGKKAKPFAFSDTE